MLLSIIVPVYNVQGYLRRCINSLLKENRDEPYEIILIDDGSTDLSTQICDEYSSEYEYVKTIHKQNGGLSSARNAGIETAKGEYVMFVDSDDYLIGGSLVKLIEIMEDGENDVIVGQSLMTYDSGAAEYETVYRIKRGRYSSEEYAKALRRIKKGVLFCAQYHICKKSFLLENDLTFKIGVLHEDELWTPQVLLKARSIYYSNVMFYCHYMRTGSIMHSNNYKHRGESLIVITSDLLKVFDDSRRKDIQFFRDRLCNFFLQSSYMVESNETIRKMRTVPIKNAFYFNSIVKSIVYTVSPRFYVFLHRVLKGKTDE